MAHNLGNPKTRQLDVDDLTDAQFELVRNYLELVRSPDRAVEAGSAFKRLLTARRPLDPELSEEDAHQLADEAVTWARRAG